MHGRVVLKMGMKEAIQAAVQDEHGDAIEEREEKGVAKTMVVTDRRQKMQSCRGSRKKVPKVEGISGVSVNK